MNDISIKKGKLNYDPAIAIVPLPQSSYIFGAIFRFVYFVWIVCVRIEGGESFGRMSKLLCPSLHGHTCERIVYTNKECFSTYTVASSQFAVHSGADGRAHIHQQALRTITYIHPDDCLWQRQQSRVEANREWDAWERVRPYVTVPS